MAKSRELHGPDAFHQWYGAMHPERWSGLVRACNAPNGHFALQAGLLKPYFLDPASVAAALCLDVIPGMSVLDLCAAPGGKSLVIAQRLFGLVQAEPDMEELGQLVMSESRQSGTGYVDDPEDDNIDPESVNAGGENSWHGGHDISYVSSVPANLSSVPANLSSVPANLSSVPKEAAYSHIQDEFSEQLGSSLLVANERSAARRGRLRQVLHDHLPVSCHGGLKITGFDATTWGQHEAGRYERILLDIPCSSERHLIQAPQWLKDWSPRRSTQLAQQAYVMGLSAGRALAPGGRLLFSTCALSDLENDQAVERILKRSVAQESRFAYRLEPLAAKLPVLLPGMEVEPTEFGFRIWPDRGGFGPLYFALLGKT